jgi:hypothetical protein
MFDAANECGSASVGRSVSAEPLSFARNDPASIAALEGDASTTGD